MALRRAKWTHEFNTKMNLRKVFFGMPKILPPLTKLLPKPEKLHRRSYDGLRCPHEWPDVFTIRAEFEDFLYRVSIWCQIRDSLTPASPNGLEMWRESRLGLPLCDETNREEIRSPGGVWYRLSRGFCSVFIARVLLGNSAHRGGSRIF